MSVFTTDARLVLTSVNGPDEAARMGQTLVDEQLAACATILPGAHSIYRWQGKVEHAHETLLLLKTTAAQLEPLEARLHALHGYQTPEFLVLPTEAASRAYQEWLTSTVRTPVPACG